MTKSEMNRRQFMHSSAAVGAGLIFSPMVLGEAETGTAGKNR